MHAELTSYPGGQAASQIYSFVKETTLSQERIHATLNTHNIIQDHNSIFMANSSFQWKYLPRNRTMNDQCNYFHN